jgi:hypothetical protein
MASGRTSMVCGSKKGFKSGRYDIPVGINPILIVHVAINILCSFRNDINDASEISIGYPLLYQRAAF